MTEELLRWAKTYLEQKDIHKKEISSLTKEDPWDIILNLKNGTRKLCKIEKQFDPEKLLPLLGIEPVFVFLPNTRKNFQMLVQHWQALKTFPKLCIFFVNPHSATETKWIIYPYTHDRITEKES
ncbi:hypothetical protein J4410_07725, partial [Candidatus Woesearchaeota archaeon]|nr:hypothetical protein [Candidatus Woesearchaeota archaeon]